MTIILSDLIYIPADEIDSRTVKKHYRHRFYEEADCRRCENRPERHNYLCNKCPAFKDQTNTYKERSRNGRLYYGLPFGDREIIEDRFSIDFSDYEIKDFRCKAKRRYPVKMVGFTPYDYQVPAVESMRKAKYGILKAPPRSGKCVTGDTLLQTEFGIHKYEALFDGLEVPDKGEEQYLPREFELLTPSGVRKTSHIYRKWADKVISVRTRSGHSIRGVAEHPLLVLTSNLTYAWKTLDEIQEGDYLCMNRDKSMFPTTNFKSDYEHEYYHTSAEKVDLPKVICEDLAAILGYLVADGCLGSKSLSFCTSNVEVMQDFKEKIRSVFGLEAKDKVSEGRTPQALLNSKAVMSCLAAFGLPKVRSAGKEIPSSVLQSSEPIVRAFLEAYFSCDSGTSRQSVTLTSASHNLIKQMQVLLSNFGIVATRYRNFKKATNSRTPTVRPYYNLGIRGFEVWKFHSEFKLMKFQNKETTRARSKYDYVPYLRDLFRERLPLQEDKNAFNGCKLYRDYHYLGYNKVLSVDVSKMDVDTAATVEMIRRKNFFYSPVVSKQELIGDVLVYDATVPKGHHYLGNGIASHNTPTMLYAAITQFKYRIVMIADQREFLQQFLDHVAEYTNLPEIEEKVGKKLFGFAKTEEELKNFEIAVCTYQTFLSLKGKKLLKVLNKNYGTLLLDECHSAAAPQYSGIMNSIKCFVRFGATGTTERKDKRDKIIKQIIGGVTALIDIPQLKANVYVHPIDFTKSRAKYVGKGGFSRLVNFLSEHEKRNDMIVEWAVKDIKAGHSLVIPVERKEHVWYLVKRINDEIGREVAGGFTGGGNKAANFQREQTLEDAKSGKIRAVIGIRSLLQRGLNVPRWSMIYGVMPINNESNWKQESSRILTPMEGKRDPGIRLFADLNLQMVLNCYANTYKQSVEFGHLPTDTAKKRHAELLKKLRTYYADRRSDSALMDAEPEVHREKGLYL